MGTAVSCTEYSQVVGLIQKFRSAESFLKGLSLCVTLFRTAVLSLNIIVTIIYYVLSMHKHVHVCTEVLEIPEVLNNKA